MRAFPFNQAIEAFVVKELYYADFKKETLLSAIQKAERYLKEKLPSAFNERIETACNELKEYHYPIILFSAKGYFKKVLEIFNQGSEEERCLWFMYKQFLWYHLSAAEGHIPIVSWLAEVVDETQRSNMQIYGRFQVFIQIYSPGIYRSKIAQKLLIGAGDKIILQKKIATIQTEITNVQKRITTIQPYRIIENIQKQITAVQEQILRNSTQMDMDMDIHIQIGSIRECITAARECLMGVREYLTGAHERLEEIQAQIVSVQDRIVNAQERIVNIQEQVIIWTKTINIQALMLKYDNYGFFREACQNEDLDFIDDLFFSLKGRHPDLIQEMLSAGNYEIVHEIVQRGSLALIRKVLSEIVDQQKMLSVNDYRIAHEIIRRGNLVLIQEILNRLPAGMSRDAIFVSACRGGHRTLEKFFSSREQLEQIQKMIKLSDYKPFYEACQSDIVVVRKFLSEATDKEKEDMISANDYEIFIKAVDHGDLAIIKELTSWAIKISHLGPMLQAAKCKAFRKACEDGNLVIAKFLIFMAAKIGQLEEMFDINEMSHIFYTTCSKNDLEMAHFLLSVAERIGQMETMLNISKYEIFYIFRKSCWNGNLALMNFLISAVEKINQVREILGIRKHEILYAFPKACWESNLRFVNFFLFVAEKANQLREVLSHNDYEIFYHIFRWGGVDKEVLKLLFFYAQRAAIFTSSDCEALYESYEKGNPDFHLFYLLLNSKKKIQSAEIEAEIDKDESPSIIVKNESNSILRCTP